jgi:hypothetical protein
MPVDSLHEAPDLFSRFVETPEDTPGLLAYALHRQTLRDWEALIREREGAPPDLGAIRAFEIAEALPGRIMAYRALAEQRLSASRGQTRPRLIPRPDPRAFVFWGLSPAAQEGESAPPWGAFFIRLLLLLVAVVASALLMRAFIHPA